MDAPLVTFKTMMADAQLSRLSYPLLPTPTHSYPLSDALSHFPALSGG